MSLTDEIKAYEKLAQKEASSKQLPIPIEKFANLQNAERAILDSNIDNQVFAGIVTIKHSDKWKEWGFTSDNSVLLFTGPSGTGKTTTARWIAKHLRKSLITVDMGDISTGNAGDGERNIKRVFTVGTTEGAIIFFDECDAILWDRSKAGPDSMWMLGIINCVLTELEKYDGIVILASNFHHILDKALLRRVTFQIEFTTPSFQTRRKLWIKKWPKWPLALPTHAIDDLAATELTGAEIEKVIEDEARFAITEDRNPSIETLKALIPQGKNRSEITTTSKIKTRLARGR